MLESKKVKMSIIGILGISIVQIGGYYLKLPSEVLNKISEGILAICGIYIGSQGLSDGLSKGETSSSSMKKDNGEK